MYTVMAMILFLSIGCFFLLFYSPIPEKSDFDFDINKIRKLSRSIPGEPPTFIASSKIAGGTFPGFFVIAGNPFDKYPIDWRTYQIVYGDGTSFLVDPTHNEAFHKEFPLSGDYFKARYDEMQTVLATSNKILFTHEHWDHMVGLSQSPHIGDVIDNIVITKEQLNSWMIEYVKFDADYLSQLRPLDYDHYHTVAPGVVLIKAQGHTPGNQIIYVALQSGEEFIFGGDIAYNQANLRRGKGRTWLASFLGKETSTNRLDVANQLRVLKTLYEETSIHVIVSHDEDLNAKYISQGLIQERLSH